MQGDFINETDTSTRMTAPAITGGAEGKLQRPQWQPGQPPRRRIRFYYCTIIMIIEWHNTRFSHIDWHIYASMNYVNIDLDNGPVACLVLMFYVKRYTHHETIYTRNFLNMLCQFWLIVGTLIDWFDIVCLSSYYEPNIQSNQCVNCSFDRAVQYINTKLPCILTRYACVYQSTNA